MGTVDLGSFSTGVFDKGAGRVKQLLWFLVNAFIVRASWNPFMKIKILLLKAFGAKIGRGLIIKNEVRIKFPWKLRIGDNVWLGENCWIDNLDEVVIGDNVCISQGALLITGNHDYTKTTFNYRNAPIKIEDGAWIGANVTVTSGVTVAENSVLTAGSILTHDTEPNMIYQGNPAKAIRQRMIAN